MKTCSCFLAVWLIAASSTLRAEEMPITFARSGQKMMLSVRDDVGKRDRPAALWAFGRRWGEPLMVRNGMAEFTAPKVRVPVVFRLIPEEDGKLLLGDLVVYPGPFARWDKDTQLLAAGTPDWFNTWSEAVGLPVQRLKDLKPGDGGNWRVLERPALLVLGEKASRNSLVAVFRVAAEHQCNVLVLGTDWFGANETISRDIAISPKQMTGALADLQGQNWPLPPIFRQRLLRIANRQTWIAGPEYPLVEEIRNPQAGTESLRTVFSYLPWQQQLGRSEMADELFLRLLTETAKGARDRPPVGGHWRLLYPAAKEIEAGERPVLAAAMRSAKADVGSEAQSQEIRAYVLDLRGKASPPSDFFEGTGAMKTIEARIGTQSPLLILGDNPILDAWKWLALDRPHHRSPRSGVLWWPDNSLPSSVESQLRLMQIFTQWNVFLGHDPQEVRNEDRKNQP